MPLAPIPWLITDLTPEVIKALDGSIQTGAGRDGSRVTGPALPGAPAFTVSKTDTTITAVITSAYGATSYEVSINGTAWVSGLTVSGLTAETPYPLQVRGINESGTGAASAVITVTTNAGYNPVGVIFSEIFDDQPDWTSRMNNSPMPISRMNGNTTTDLPDNWDGCWDGKQWHPQNGHPDKHAALEILSSNADKSRTGTGKSAVFWRESYSLGWKNWASDAQTVKVFDNDYEEMYAEFWIKFAPGFWQRDLANKANWTSKMFRMGSWGRSDLIWNGGNGNVGPRVIWDYKQDAYSVRNVMTLLEGPNGSYEKITEFSRNYTTNTQGMAPGGTNPNHLNILTGAPLASGPTAWHEDVFGPAEHWTKMGFYVKMNSSPGVQDGVLKQWINDERIYSKTDLAWVVANADNEMASWNYIAIGGNDWFQEYPNEDRFEDWWALDDLVVRDSLPEGLE